MADTAIMSRSQKYSSASSPSTKVIQITNIAPQATKDQMQSLFGCIGKIDEIRLYPTVRDVTCPVISRICFVKFFEGSCVSVAQHLTNTVFIDRALIVCPVASGIIPDEFKALEITSNGTTVPGLHTADSNLPFDVVNRIDGVHPFQVVKTSDPKLAEFNLPEYPPLPANYDARKIEEIRRTIIVIDIPSDWEMEELMRYFSDAAGEIKYARFAEKNRQKYCMFEFCEQKSVAEALKIQGAELHGHPLNIYHSMQAIIKPEAKSNEAAQREIEEAMSIVKEAQNMISAAIDPVIGMLSATKDKASSVSRRRSRSRTRSRSHSRERSRSKRSKSRKRSRRSRSRSRRRRSRSRSRRRSSSRGRSKRSRSRSKRPRSRDRRKRSRSRRRSRSRTDERRRTRTRSRDRKRSRSRDRKKKSSRKEEKRRKSRSRSKSRTRRHSKTRTSRPKDTSRSSKHHEKERDPRSGSKANRVASEREVERRSRTPPAEKTETRTKESKKLKRVSEEKITRDYDAEEKIGTSNDETPSKPTETSPEKSDNMDISNSP